MRSIPFSRTLVTRVPEPFNKREDEAWLEHFDSAILIMGLGMDLRC